MSDVLISGLYITTLSKSTFNTPNKTTKIMSPNVVCYLVYCIRVSDVHALIAFSPLRCQTLD